MKTPDSEERTTSASQRPTLEIVNDDSLEFSTLPPSDVPPDPEGDRATIPGSAQASWPVLAPSKRLPLKFELRLLLGVLRALTPVHTNLTVPPDERVYGRVCRQNVRVDPDGTVRLCPLDEAMEPSGELRAPEALGQGTIDQQADLYAVGALVLAALESEPTGRNAWTDSVRSIAARAVRLDPRARWTSANEFAAQLEAAMGSRLPSQQALQVILRSSHATSATAARMVAESIPDSELEEVCEPTSVRATIVSLADSDVRADDPIDLQADRYEPIDCMGDASLPTAALDFDEETVLLRFEGARPATSTVPGELPFTPETPSRKPRWIGVAAVTLVAAATWGAFSLTTLRGPQSAEVRPSLHGEVLSVQPQSPTVSASPSTSPAASAPAAQDEKSLGLRPPPSATASFPPVPAPNAKPITAPRSGKPKAPSPRPSTYDPEGI